MSQIRHILFNLHLKHCTKHVLLISPGYIIPNLKGILLDINVKYPLRLIAINQLNILPILQVLGPGMSLQLYLPIGGFGGGLNLAGGKGQVGGQVLEVVKYCGQGLLVGLLLLEGQGGSGVNVYLR